MSKFVHIKELGEELNKIKYYLGQINFHAKIDADLIEDVTHEDIWELLETIEKKLNVNRVSFNELTSYLDEADKAFRRYEAVKEDNYNYKFFTCGTFLATYCVLLPPLHLHNNHLQDLLNKVTEENFHTINKLTS